MEITMRNFFEIISQLCTLNLDKNEKMYRL